MTHPAARHALHAAFVVALTFAASACRTDGSPEPSGAGADSSTTPATTSASAFTVANTDGLVSSERLSHAAPSDACSRLATKAASVKNRMSHAPLLAEVASKVGAVATDFGAFDPLLFGEVHRSFSAYTERGAITATQLDMLTADLGKHALAAGATAESVSALKAALLAFRSGPADLAPLRLAASALVVDVADLLADVQSCSPKS